jgi:CO/xanthine dehydrogenase FAD-binding subunit
MWERVCMKAFDYAAPRSISETVALLAEKGPRARVLAGGTDLIVQLRENRRQADLVVDVKHVPEANALEYDPQRGLVLGAAVPCWRLVEHPGLSRAYPGLIEAAALIGGVQIQSRASVGGNLCNASPAADTIPALIAGEAVCQITGPAGHRELPVEQFCTAPGKNALEPGEFLVCLRLPPPRPRSGSAYLRFIPRNEMDIAVVGAGVAVTWDESHTRCSHARVALAAVAPTPLLVSEAAAVLVGSHLDEADVARAASRAQAAARPISDMRGDAEYRRHLVGVLVQRALRSAAARAKEK